MPECETPPWGSRCGAPGVRQGEAHCCCTAQLTKVAKAKVTCAEILRSRETGDSESIRWFSGAAGAGGENWSGVGVGQGDNEKERNEGETGFPQV